MIYYCIIKSHVSRSGTPRDAGSASQVDARKLRGSDKGPPLYIYIYIYIYIHTYMHICMCVCAYVCVYVCMHALWYVCM